MGVCKLIGHSWSVWVRAEGVHFLANLFGQTEQARELGLETQRWPISTNTNAVEFKRICAARVGPSLHQSKPDLETTSPSFLENRWRNAFRATVRVRYERTTAASFALDVSLALP